MGYTSRRRISCFLERLMATLLRNVHSVTPTTQPVPHLVPGVGVSIAEQHFQAEVHLHAHGMLWRILEKESISMGLWEGRAADIEVHVAQVQRDLRLALCVQDPAAALHMLHHDRRQPAHLTCTPTPFNF